MCYPYFSKHFKHFVVLNNEFTEEKLLKSIESISLFSQISHPKGHGKQVFKLFDLKV